MNVCVSEKERQRERDRERERENLIPLVGSQDFLPCLLRFYPLRVGQASPFIVSHCALDLPAGQYP